MNHNENINKIHIKELILELNYICSQKNKSNFMTKYNELKAKIESIDNILITSSNIDAITYINELFTILENSIKMINDDNNLEINTFNMLLDVIKILEEKIQL